MRSTSSKPSANNTTAVGEDSQPVEKKDVETKEKEVTFCMDPLSGLFYHDGSATKVKASALYFDSKSTEYKSVFGAVATGEEVKFSLTTGTDVTSASLFFKGMENKAFAMSKEGEAVNSDGAQQETASENKDDDVIDAEYTKE